VVAVCIVEIADYKPADYKPEVEFGDSSEYILDFDEEYIGVTDTLQVAEKTSDRKKMAADYYSLSFLALLRY
jgi:hypothetical protein